MYQSIDFNARVLIIANKNSVSARQLYQNIHKSVAVDNTFSWISACHLSYTNQYDIIIHLDMGEHEEALHYCQQIRSSKLNRNVFFILKGNTLNKNDFNKWLNEGGIEVLMGSEPIHIVSYKILSLLRYFKFNISQYKKEDRTSTIMDERIEASEKLFIEKAKHFIKLNISNPDYSVCELADSMNMSHNSFYRKMKRTTGKSAKQFIIDERLRYAQKLIINTEHPIYNIMMRSGFSTASYFSRCFKKAFGIKPSSLRNKKAA